MPNIKLYGSADCHKSSFYRKFLNDSGLPYNFLDVIVDKDAAEELRSLYTNGKLNFPTITIGAKKLRNPHTEELKKWIARLIPDH
jgi:arsenate reductase-like glutaredoxin family protein